MIRVKLTESVLKIAIATKLTKTAETTQGVFAFFFGVNKDARAFFGQWSVICIYAKC